MEGFGGPEWHAEDIVLPDAPKDKVTLFYRDLQECGDFQFGRPWFTGKMTYGPTLVYAEDDTTRLYEGPETADSWNKRQVSRMFRLVLRINTIKCSVRYLLARHMVECSLRVMLHN
jgi:hypothetical protein